MSALREVTYQHRDPKCMGLVKMKLPKSPAPFRRWLMSCVRCGKYGLHEVTSRPLSGGWR